MMAKTFKALSLLLSYPTPKLQQNAAELRDILASEHILAGRARQSVNLLVDEIAHGDIYDLQERYVLLFDRTRSLSLHLFEHVHGESRDRGQAMIDLKAQYETNGLAISASELPDFLPLFLEYLSTRPLGEAGEMLGQTSHILSALGERLRRRKSPYEAVLRALVAIAASRPKDEDVAELLREPDPDPNDLEALDAAWEDEQVAFGPGSGGCRDGLIARVRAGLRPAATPQA